MGRLLLPFVRPGAARGGDILLAHAMRAQCPFLPPVWGQATAWFPSPPLVRHGRRQRAPSRLLRSLTDPPAAPSSTTRRPPPKSSRTPHAVAEAIGLDRLRMRGLPGGGGQAHSRRHLRPEGCRSAARRYGDAEYFAHTPSPSYLVKCFPAGQGSSPPLFIIARRG